MSNEINLIILKREAKAYPDGSIPGTLYVGPRQFPTIERGGRYVDLKVGDYEMVHSTKTRGKGLIKCLRPIENTVKSILIHDAWKDSSLELKGCISPGMTKKPPPGKGIMNAAAAMEEIWRLLGGWEKGKKVTLRIANNVPGESRTKETWDRVRDPRLRRL